MKFRDITIFTGEQFSVPQCIQRIDTRGTHGWQVRYHGTKMFSDQVAGGGSAAKALSLATRELLKRIAALPAPVTLQRAPSAHKTSDLPSGISGPIIRQRKGSKVRVATLSVLLPQFGATAKSTTIHIGSENTYSVQRFDRAVERAIQRRKQAEERYEKAATQARRKAGTALRSALMQQARST